MRGPATTAVRDRAGRRSWRIAAFAAVCVVCGLGAVVAISRGGTTTSGGAVETDTESLADIQAGPHAVLVDTRPGNGFGHAAVVNPAAPDRIVDTDLVCDRVDMAADRGICLQADRGVITTYKAVVFDEDFQELDSYDLPGIPSRTRVSADGDYAAWTTFVSGDSYLSQGLSTRTHITNLRTGEAAGDLEKFAVVKDGEPFSEVDFNFWGVTFARDPNTFYATLATGGHVYLVQGDVGERELTVLHEGVECPMLSPDGTRIAYKTRVTGDLGRTEWRLAVLDLATMQSHDLQGDRNVDDQVQWLDDDTVMYGVPEADSGTPSKDTYAVAADGAGPPRLLVPGAWSLSRVIG